MHCYLIDDDLEDQEIFALALEKLGSPCTFAAATSASEALSKFEADPSFIPDIIFLDLNLPQMNGRQFLAEIKKKNDLKHIPVVIYSTSSLPTDIHETRLLGASDYMVKPPSIQILQKSITSILEKLFPGDTKSVN